MEALLSVAGAARNGAGSGFLGAHDAERLISGLSDFNVDDVGSPKWTSQREALERLNVQAHHNAVTHSDEFVKEFLVSHDKVRVLIRELLVIEVWKEKVWKHFDDDALAAGIGTCCISPNPGTYVCPYKTDTFLLQSQSPWTCTWRTTTKPR